MIQAILQTIIPLSIIIIVALLVCILSKCNWFEKYVINLFYSEKVNNIFQAAITFSSIALGFSGTLIVQILTAKKESDKKEKRNLIRYFFEDINAPKLLSNYILLSVLFCMATVILSLIMLTYYAMPETVRYIMFLVWLFSILVFILYEIIIYKNLIYLLFNNNDEVELYYNKPTEDELQKINENISKRR